MEWLKVNGKRLEYQQGKLPATITDLLRSMDIDSAAVVAEIDGNIVPRDNFDSFQIVSGQTIELIRFVGGG